MLNPVRPRPSRTRYLALLGLLLAVVGAGITASLFIFTSGAQGPPRHRTPTGPATTSAPGAVVFSGNWETGDISQWTWGAQCANYSLVGNAHAGDVHVVSDNIAQGGYAARFDVPVDPIANNSCEVLRKRTQALGSDQFYAQEVYFPSDWRDPSAWGMAVGQYNFSGVGQGAPVGVDARADHVNLSISSGLCVAHGPCQYTTGNDWPNDQGTLNTTLRIVPPGTHLAGTWQQWIVHVHWAAGSSGHIDAWWRQRGATSWTKTVNWGGYPTVQWTSEHAPEANDVTSDKIGAYRGPAIFPISIWQDGFCVATSFSAAASCL
jgi:polysaccharide lyase-like protein